MNKTENNGVKENSTPNQNMITSEVSIIEEISGNRNFKNNLHLSFMVVIYFIFNLIAAAIFISIEKKSTEGQPHWLPKFKEEFLQNHSDCLNGSVLEKFLKRLEEAIAEDSISIVGNTTLYPVQWTLNSAFFLSATISSTIGYGTLTPVTSGGQIFASLFALIAIPFTGILAAKLGIATAYYVEKLFARLLELVSKVNWASLTFTLLVGFLLYILMPTFILYFISNEEQWTFVNCFYCVIISMTTVGFGDFVPDPDEGGGLFGSMLILVWVIAGLAWFATIIQLISTQLAIHAAILKQKMDDTTPAFINRLQDGSFSFEIGGNLFQIRSVERPSRSTKTSTFRNSRQPSQHYQPHRASELRQSEIHGPSALHAAIMAHSDIGLKRRESELNEV